VRVISSLMFINTLCHLDGPGLVVWTAIGQLSSLLRSVQCFALVLFVFVVYLGTATGALAATVSISAGTTVTREDLAQFDAAWMSDPQAQLGWFGYALKNRGPWVQWDLIEASTAMVRLFDLTRDPKYLMHLKSIAEIVLHY